MELCDHYSFRMLLAACLALAGLVLAEPDAVAQDSDEVVLRLVIPSESIDADSVSRSFEAETLEQITEEAVRRLRRRLDAAEFKHASVEKTGNNELTVRVRGDVDRREVGGVVIPSGKMELRPVREMGTVWTKHADKLPSGIEIRQPADSLRAESAYLWSRSRSRLEEAIEAPDLDQPDVGVFPSDGGWRSIAMGEVVVGQSDVDGVELRHASTGSYFVHIQLGRRVVQPSSTKDLQQWALKLDDEIVTVFGGSAAKSNGALELAPPEHIGGEKARLRWARQVAGLLAAYIPVPLVLMKDG